MSLYNELKRRNVFRVAVAYLALAWLLIEVSGTLFPVFGIPDWGVRLVVIVFALGFLPALIISWVYELTSEGIKREKDVVRDSSITHLTAKRLDLFTIGLIVVAVIFILADRLWLNPGTSQIPESPVSIVADDVSSVLAETIKSETPGNSIAVLPFANRSSKPDDAFFVDGIHDDLLSHISRIGSIKTISRTSVMQYRDSVKSIPQIARELGVGTVLEGGVQRAGQQVRINVQLIDASTDAHLWAETYDRELTAQNIFAIQSEIAQSIASNLKAVLSPEEESRISAVPTHNFAAYEEYLRGSQKMVLREIPEIREAVGHFRNSIELDPAYAMAYAGLANAYFLLRYYGDMSVAESDPLLESAVEHALKLDPELGEAHTTYAAQLENKGLLHEAVGAYEKAIKLAPGNATSYHWLAELWRRSLDDPQQAFPLISKALKLDPLSPVINITLAETLRDLGRYEDALKQINRAIEIAPGYHSAYIIKAEILAWSFGKLDQGLQNFRQASELDSRSIFACIGSARILSQLGDVSLATLQIEQSLVLGPDFLTSHSTAANFFQTWGDSEQAVHHARRVLAINPSATTSLRILRDADIRNSRLASTRQRYENVFPEFTDLEKMEVKGINFRQAIDYAYLLSISQESEKMRHILLSVLDFLPGVHRLGFGSKNIDDVRALAMLGETQQALDTLAASVADGWRLNWRMYLDTPELDSIRADPEFMAQREILEADMATQLERVQKVLADQFQ